MAIERVVEKYLRYSNYSKLPSFRLVEFDISEKMAPEEFSLFCKIFTPPANRWFFFIFEMLPVNFPRYYLGFKIKIKIFTVMNDNDDHLQIFKLNLTKSKTTTNCLIFIFQRAVKSWTIQCLLTYFVYLVSVYESPSNLNSYKDLVGAFCEMLIFSWQ